MRQVVTGLAGTLGALAYTRFLQPEDLGAFGLAFLVYSGLPLSPAEFSRRDDDGTFRLCLETVSVY